MKKFLLGCVALAFAASPAFAQEADVQITKTVVQSAKAAVETVNADVDTTDVAETVAPAIEKIEVNEDGSITGNVFANVNGEETPVDAKVTIASEGVVIEAVQAENGSFSFANIAPGTYTLTGTTQDFAGGNFVGGQSYEVAPFAGTGCTSCNLGLQSTNDVVYQNAPALQGSTCGSCGSTCGSCGGGGGGFGGGGGGLGTRGRRLLTAGLVGGIIAVAVSDDDDDDASPDE